jgi:hypothetical protein
MPNGRKRGRPKSPALEGAARNDALAQRANKGALNVNLLYRYAKYLEKQ